MINDDDAAARVYVIIGGTCQLPGIGARLETELRAMAFEQIFKGDTRQLARFKLRVELPRQGKHMTYIGM